MVNAVFRYWAGTAPRDETNWQFSNDDAPFGCSGGADDLGSLYAHSPCRDMQRRQRRLDQRGDFQVVEAYDGHGIRNAYLLFGTISRRTGCKNVTAAKHGRRARAGFHNGSHGMVAVFDLVG